MLQNVIAIAYLVVLFLKASTVALPSVSVKIIDQIDTVRMTLFGMLSRKLNKNQKPVIAVGTLTTNQNSVHV
jgi:hypothetical protein